MTDQRDTPLNDPAYRVPSGTSAARDDVRAGTMRADNGACAAGVAWLRATVARFCDGPDHDRRRDLSARQLSGVDVRRLRDDTAAEPVERLALELGLPAGLAADVALVALSYHPHTPIAAEADTAVGRLVAACGGNGDEETASRIGLLVQASTATAALISGTNPPVASTRRIAPSGETIEVPLTGMPFGSGPHACPGRAHALALASSQLPFHRMHHGSSPLILPNAWDFASAAAFVEAGFNAVGTTSLGLAAANGLPDAAAVTLRETLDLATKLVRLPVPITVDIEAGFGENPGELAARLWELGVAGVNIEDGRGDRLADPAEQAEYLVAFKDGAPAMFVNARVDTHWLSIDTGSTIARALRYAAAGVDGVFVPGLVDDREIEELIDVVALPLNVLAGRDPKRLGELGVRRISTGSLPFRAALGAAVTAAKAARDGEHIRSAPSYEDVQALAGLTG